MTAALRLQTTVPADRCLRVDLPASIPVGTPVTVLVEGASAVLPPGDEAELTDAEQRHLWTEWIATEHDGPIMDEDLAL